MHCFVAVEDVEMFVVEFGEVDDDEHGVDEIGVFTPHLQAEMIVEGVLNVREGGEGDGRAS